jgi:hypothetical protein
MYIHRRSCCQGGIGGSRDQNGYKENQQEVMERSSEEKAAELEVFWKLGP